MVRAQFKLLDHLGVQKLYASVGSSMGGMQSLAAGWLFPDRVSKIVSISGTARSSPGSIAMRHAQRSGSLFRHLVISFANDMSVLMADPNWNNGFYYDQLPPHTGMKLARRKFPYNATPPHKVKGLRLAEIATITYRSGPEWDQRFGRKLRELKDGQGPPHSRSPTLCPDFLIETYLDHQVSAIHFNTIKLTDKLPCRESNSA
jgi:homoserine O-acetyltransferase